MFKEKGEVMGFPLVASWEPMEAKAMNLKQVVRSADKEHGPGWCGIVVRISA